MLFSGFLFRLFFGIAGAIFLLSGQKRLFQADHVFSWAEAVHDFGFFADLLFAVVRSFDRETDAALRAIHFDDAGFHGLSDLENIFDFRHMVFADLRDVDQPIDVARKRNECAEVSDFCNGSSDEVADFEGVFDRFPRVFFDLFDTQADALVAFVDVDDHRLDFVSFFEDFARVVDLAGPAQVGDMNHAVDAFFEFDERTIGGHVTDLAFDLFADDVALFDLVPRIGFELADAQGDFEFVLVDSEHESFDFLPEAENIGRTRNAFCPREFGNMDETFDPLLDFHERAVRHEVGNFPFDLAADGEAVFDIFPRVGETLFETERDPFFFVVDVEDDDFDFLAHGEGFRRVVDASPRDVGDMEETVDAIEVDERTEVREVLDLPLDLVADLHGSQELLAFVRAFLFDDFAAAEDHIFAVFVDFDDFEIVGVVDELGEVFRWDDVDLRGGKECFHADIDDQAAFDNRADAAFDKSRVFKDFFDFVPVLALGSLFLGKDDHTFVVFEPFEQDFHFVAYFDVLDIFEFACGDHALRFVANVHEKFIRANFEDVSFDDASFFVIFDRFFDQFLELSHG